MQRRTPTDRDIGSPIGSLSAIIEFSHLSEDVGNGAIEPLDVNALSKAALSFLLTIEKSIASRCSPLIQHEVDRLRAHEFKQAYLCMTQP